MFRKKWPRNSVAKLVVEMEAGVAAGIFVGVVVLNPLYAYLNISLADESGWAEYAFYGACGALGGHFFGRIRKTST